MTTKPPHIKRPEIRQPLAAAGASQVDTLDAIIILLPETSLKKPWPDFPHAERLKQRVPVGKESLSPLRADLPNPRGTVAILATYKTDASAFEFLTLARKCVAKARETQPASLGLLFPGAEAGVQGRLAEALLAAVVAADFEMPQFKARPEKPHAIASITVFDGKRTLDFSRCLAEAEGNGLARWLTLLPANKLTPTEYRGHVQDLARREGWRSEFLDEKKLKSLGAGAFLAVSQGSETRDAGIVHLTYKPAKPARGAKALALVLRHGWGEPEVRQVHVRHARRHAGLGRGARHPARPHPSQGTLRGARLARPRP
jgi:leucyl aminopeptidase